MVEQASCASFFEKLFATHKFHLAVLLVLSSLLLLANLHEGGLAGYDDSLYAHEARQMVTTGDWWNVRFNGFANFENPPMFIWMDAASLSVLGTSDFSAKFPSALAGVLTILVVFLLGRMLTDNFWLPVCAAWILMLTQYFLKYSMHAMTDVPYTLFFTLAIFFYVMSFERPWVGTLCGAAIACAILTRSVLGLIPVAVIAGHAWWTRSIRPLRLRQLVLGMLPALLLPSIWYVSQYRLYGEPFLAGHASFIFGKILSSGGFDIAGLLWGLTVYPRYLLTLYWPWLPFMLVGLWTQTHIALRDRKPSAALLVIWVLFVVAPFSLIDAKVLRYIMAAFPAFALLSAIPMSDWLGQVKRTQRIRSGYLALCALVVGIVIFARPYPRAEEMSRIGAIVEAEAEASERVVLYTYGELRHDIRNQFLWYSNRFCDWLLDPAELRQYLQTEANWVFVVDRPSYDRLVLPMGLELETYLASDDWVAFRRL